MTREEFLRKYWIGILIILSLVFLFFPKKCGYSYGGFITITSILHREDCNCLGFKYSTFGDIFNLQRCSDCGKTYFCVGIPVEKKCYEWVADGTNDFSTEKEIECK